MTRGRRRTRNARRRRFYPERWWRAWRRTHPAAQLLLAVLGVLTLWFVSNGLYQVIRKPTELYFPVSGVLNRTPAQTWDAYAPLFKRHATATITPAFLAALAQIEGSGNPVVRTYWRWRWTSHPFEVYRPASSAVGMYQITDGTFALARRYCIHSHVVVEDGPWHAWRSCWFNSLYSRVIPSHAVELTSAYLDRSVALALAQARIRRATPRQQLELAALIHLCGAGAGHAHARRGLRLTPGRRCGDHDVHRYLARMHAMRTLFERLGRQD